MTEKPAFWSMAMLPRNSLQPVSRYSKIAIAAGDRRRGCHMDECAVFEGADGAKPSPTEIDFIDEHVLGIARLHKLLKVA